MTWIFQTLATSWWYTIWAVLMIAGITTLMWAAITRQFDKRKKKNGSEKI